MPRGYTTYSFKDLSLSLNHPLGGAFSAAGNLGIGQVTISMATDKTAHDVAADGGIMVSALPGHNGTVAIEMQQTSDFHKFLLAWYNLVKVAADAGDVGNWANLNALIRNILDGSSHICTGGSPVKLPDKPYAAQGSRVTWNLLFANIDSFTA